MATEQQLRALERYRLNADLIRRTFQHHWDENLGTGRSGRGDPNEPVFFAWMSLWYSALWVVWEGSESLGLELNLKDESQDQHRELLREFRNKTFHPQRAFPPPAVMRYVELETSVSWAYALSSELTRAIRREAERLGMSRNEDGYFL